MLKIESPGKRRGNTAVPISVLLSIVAVIVVLGSGLYCVIRLNLR
jgi:hypothetical protein